jgi:subtilase family serine protease
MGRGRAITRILVGCAAIAALLAAASAAGSRVAPAGRATRLATVHVFPMVHIPGREPTAAPSGGYTPAQLRAAYFINPLLRSGVTGKRQSIVIVDSFGSPTIRHDLAVFDRQFKITAPPSLLIIHPAGRIPAFRGTVDQLNWAAETTLDVEWAHAMAPGARIVLVETPVSENEGTSGFPQIVKAEKYVLGHHLGGVISQSFGATEETFPKGTLRPLRGAYFEAAQRAHNVTVLGASGDFGSTDYKSDLSSLYTFPVTSWPASDPLVTSIGGLNLALNRRGVREAPDSVWNDFSGAGGGGKSVVFGRPAFQDGVRSSVGGQRGVPDISMSASCSHPVDIFSSFAGSGAWETICGTSEATPLFAGVIALADQLAGHPLGPINGLLYHMAAAHYRGIVDVKAGNNTWSFFQGGKSYTVQGWAAVPGYDLASGVGTIRGDFFVRELVALAKKTRG